MEPFIISNHLKFLEQWPGQEFQSMNHHQRRIHLKEIQGDQSATTNTDNCYSDRVNFNFVMIEADYGLYSRHRTVGNVTFLRN
jgi:hypothetical protein